MRVHIAATGCADTLGIVSSSGSAELDDAALAGAEKMSFLPATREGRPVDSIKIFRVAFKLHESE